MKTLEELKSFFNADEYVKLSGIEIISSNQSMTVCKAMITPKHLNANNYVQGGMLFTIADFTFAVHANSLLGLTLTQTASISYIAPAFNTTYITAEITELVWQNKTSVGKVTVKDDKDKIVCVVQITGFTKTN